MFEFIEQPLVSIIMPTYNRAGYIIESVKSIQQQTYGNWELIIVDDGSEDNTEELIGGLKDHRIKFYKCGKIGIVGKLKNIGIHNSGGELIAFNDSDDLWVPCKLEKQIAALREHPEAGFCMTGGYNFKKPGEPTEYFYKERQGKKSGNFFYSMFQSGIAGFTQTLMIRKECISITGGFEESEHITMNDIDFIVKLSYHFDAVLLYEPMVYRRLHDNNYIHSNWIKSYYEGILIVEEYQKKKMLPDAIASEALFKLYVNFGEDCLLHRKRAAAITRFLISWRYKPFSIVPIKKAGKAIVNYIAW